VEPLPLHAAELEALPPETVASLITWIADAPAELVLDEDCRSLTEIAGDESLSTVAGTMAFARKQFGYDWTIGALELDRSPAQFVALIKPAPRGIPQRAVPV